VRGTARRPVIVNDAEREERFEKSRAEDGLLVKSGVVVLQTYGPVAQVRNHER